MNDIPTKQTTFAHIFLENGSSVVPPEVSDGYHSASLGSTKEGAYKG